MLVSAFCSSCSLQSEITKDILSALVPFGFSFPLPFICLHCSPAHVVIHHIFSLSSRTPFCPCSEWHHMEPSRWGAEGPRKWRLGSVLKIFREDFSSSFLSITQTTTNHFFKQESKCNLLSKNPPSLKNRGLSRMLKQPSELFFLASDPCCLPLTSFSSLSFLQTRRATNPRICWTWIHSRQVCWSWVSRTRSVVEEAEEAWLDGLVGTTKVGKKHCNSSNTNYLWSVGGQSTWPVA